MAQNRTPRGVPTGGQFVAQPHAEAGISLSEPPAPRSEPLTETDADEIAFRTENIEAWNSLDDAPGEIIEDPSTLTPGAIVYVRGHSKIRKAVVYKVGKKNATARFTTPGAYAEAEKFAPMVRENYRNRALLGDRAAEQAGKNYDYWVESSSPDYPRYQTLDQRWVDDGIAHAQRNLANAGSRDDYTEAARLAEIERIEGRYRMLEEQGLLSLTTMTNATVKPGQAKLAPIP